jgi:hypothetical protein
MQSFLGLLGLGGLVPRSGFEYLSKSVDISVTLAFIQATLRFLLPFSAAISMRYRFSETVQPSVVCSSLIASLPD